MVAAVAACDGGERPGPPPASGGRAGADASTSGGTSGNGGAAGSGGAGASGGTGASSGGSAGAGGGSPDAGPSNPVTFSDVTTEAGVGYAQHVMLACMGSGECGMEPREMSGGGAVGDFDGDGQLDLYVTRLDDTDLLFRNRGDGSFEEVASAAGLSLDVSSNGAGFADLDGDGDQDLYVTAVTADRFYLYINDAGVFTEDAVARGADVPSSYQHQGFSVSFGDYDRDGHTDIHTCEWAPFVPDSGVQRGHSRLLKNRGDSQPGHFTDETLSAGVDIDRTNGRDGVYAFSSSFADMDDDGWPDLVVAADFGTSRLFFNDGDGTFTDRTIGAFVGRDENGMGSAIGDYDGDGRLDWFVTSIYDPMDRCAGNPDCFWGASGNRLYRNLGNREFTESATDEMGVRDGFWGWGASFFDYDNDGDLDLVMTNGIDFTTDLDDLYARTPVRLWRNDGGTMTEVSGPAGLTDDGEGRGLMVLDYDDDGDLDLYITSHRTGGRLWRNDGGNDFDWLRLKLQGTDSNRDALGARVWVQPTPGAPEMVREVRGGNNFVSQNERTLHFGLGPGGGPIARVRIRWPKSGTEQTLTDVARNQTLTIVEP